VSIERHRSPDRRVVEPIGRPLNAEEKAVLTVLMQ
jgi:hypothetical protein